MFKDEMKEALSMVKIRSPWIGLESSRKFEEWRFGVCLKWKYMENLHNKIVIGIR